MSDRNLMESELLVLKGVCDLYLHGCLESSTAEVHQAFQKALEESINMQNKVYNMMAENGWYQTCEAPQAEIDKVKQKFAN